MTWEWQHGREGGQWVVTVGGWNAVVQRLGARVLWQATLTRTWSPEEQYTSPAYADAMDARLVFPNNCRIGRQAAVMDTQAMVRKPQH